MSYQIKSTPYYRRMVNNSKRNGQLQRLREEYERIQEFNERTIELKMRQVRLRRLFRDIGERNDTSSSTGASTSSRRAAPRRRHLEQLELEAEQIRQRRETLARAKQLGTQISRQNAERAEAGASSYMRHELRMSAKTRFAANAKREVTERRERTAKRISYGNEQSRSNMQRIKQRHLRRQADGIVAPQHQRLVGNAFTLNTQQQTAGDAAKRAMLQQRLEYGNSRSISNMARGQARATLNSMLGSMQLAQFSGTSSSLADCSPHCLRMRLEQQEEHANYTGTTSLEQFGLDCSETEPELEDMRTARDNLSVSDNVDGQAQGTCRTETIILGCQHPNIVSVATNTQFSNGQNVRSLALAASASAPSNAISRWHQLALTWPWVKAFQGQKSNDVDVNPSQAEENCSSGAQPSIDAASSEMHSENDLPATMAMEIEQDVEQRTESNVSSDCSTN